jgi:hypothetical protein
MLERGLIHDLRVKLSEKFDFVVTFDRVNGVI